MKKLFYDIWKGIGIFREADCFNRAAAISFYALFSLIPLMLLLTAGVGFVLGRETGAVDKVIAFVKQSLPYLGDRVIGDLKSLSKGWKALGWVGVISLVWSAEFVLDALANALAAVFGMTHRFGFFRKKIINLLVVLIALVAAIASVTMTATAKILKAIDIKVYGVDVADYFIEHHLQVRAPGRYTHRLGGLRVQDVCRAILISGAPLPAASCSPRCGRRQNTSLRCI